MNQKPSPLHRASEWIVDHYRLFFVVFAALLVFSAVASGWVKVENDVAAYLPADSETRQGLDIMEQEFQTYGSAKILLRDTDADAAAATAEQIRAVDGVSDVNAPYEIINGFQTVQKVLNIAAMVIIVVLFVVSMFIISNTIKLAMYSRSQEIAIMKMVGATNSFIRLPFVVEGLILGFISSLVAFFLEWGLYDFLASKIAQIDTLQLITIVPFAECIEFVAIAYAVTGFVVGVFGSMLSIRKFLRV